LTEFGHVVVADQAIKPREGDIGNPHQTPISVTPENFASARLTQFTRQHRLHMSFLSTPNTSIALARWVSSWLFCALARLGHGLRPAPGSVANFRDVRGPSKIALVILCSTVLAATHAMASDDEDWSPVLRRPAPRLQLKDHNGKPHDLKAYAGKTVIVNFWATWCAACVEELPSLAKFNASLDPEKTVLLTVNGEEDRNAVALFLKRRRLSITVLDDEENTAHEAWAIKSIPITWIIGPDQRLRYVAKGGADFQSSELRKILEKLNGQR
jgi:thiol-disulfide isomerase/thioredoxin